jgi:hypothetical protein
MIACNRPADTHDIALLTTHENSVRDEREQRANQHAATRGAARTTDEES